MAITQGGTLTYNTGIAAILRQSGYVVVYNGGTLNIGVAGGSEIGRSSSAQLQFDCTADGDFGLVARIGSTVSMAGLSRTAGKNISQTKLNADASAGATSITIVDDTGWLSGDVLCFAPTSRTPTQFETKATTGNATATTIAMTALTNAHSGTSPTQGEVGLLTRNVIFKGVTTNTVTFFYVATTATVSLSWTDFQYISNNSAGKRGIEINTTTGSFSMDRCTVRDTDAGWIYLTGAAFSNVTVTNNVFYNCFVLTSGNGGINVATATSGTWTIDSNMLCGATQSLVNMVQLSDVGGTFTNNSISGNTGGAGTGALDLLESGATIGTITGNVIHSNTSPGIGVNAATNGTISGGSIWRNASFGIANANGQLPNQVLTFKSIVLFGNSTANVSFQNSTYNLILDNCTLSADTTFATTAGVLCNLSGGSGLLRLCSCLTSQTSGIGAVMTNDIDFGASISVMAIRVATNDCTFASTNLFANIALAQFGGGLAFLTAQNFGGTANDNRSYFSNGSNTVASIIKTNSSTLYSTNPLSEEMQPGSASFKLPSQSIFVATRSGQVATVTVQVQKNGTYNGAAPRLILKRQDSMGVTSDTVKATFSASANTWQAQVGSSPTAPQDGVYEFIIDCDGTAGSVFVGDTSATVA
jgi:hypothetical protein